MDHSMKSFTLEVYEFEDSDTLAIDADWLNKLKQEDAISSSRRSVPRCKNLFWWIECYPNLAAEQYVSVFIFTTVGGFELTKTAKVLRSDVKCRSTTFLNTSTDNGWEKFISHDKLRLGDTIKNGIFAIRYDVKFKIPKATIETLKKLEPIEDSHTIKFNRKMIETYKPGQEIVEQKQTVGGITWWIKYYPCGETEEEKGYVSVYFYIIGGPIRLQFSCAVSADGVQFQKSSIHKFKENGNWGFSKYFSHNLLKLADHKNNIVDLVCKIKFFQPDEPIFANPAEQIASEVPTKIKDSMTISFLECQLDDNVIGEFDSTPKEFVNGSDKHQWRLSWFPVGDTTRAKGNVSLMIEASTTETKTVTLSGEIKIDGTSFKKQFNMIVETDSILAFPKLISHEELRRIGGIVDNKVTITCDGTFNTLNDLRLN